MNEFIEKAVSELFEPESKADDVAESPATETEADAKPRTLGETDPAIASEYYRNVYSRSWYRDMKSQINRIC